MDLDLFFTIFWPMYIIGLLPIGLFFYRRRHRLCYSGKLQHGEWCSCARIDCQYVEVQAYNPASSEYETVGLNRQKLDQQWRAHAFTTTLQVVGIPVVWPVVVTLGAIAGTGMGLYWIAQRSLFVAARAFGRGVVWSAKQFFRPIRWAFSSALNITVRDDRARMGNAPVIDAKGNPVDVDAIMQRWKEEQVRQQKDRVSSSTRDHDYSNTGWR